MGWLSGWSYRRAITVTAGSNGMPADYQVKIVINTASLISAGKMRSDGGDIRFTKGDGVTLLSYWIESGINTASTIIWVKDPDALSANASHIIYMYYGNPNATSQSNPDATLEFYENFASDPNTNGKWTIYRYAGDTANEFAYDSTNRRVYLTTSATYKGVMAFFKNVATPNGFRIRFKGGSGGADGWAFGFFKDVTPYQTYGKSSYGGALGLKAYDGTNTYISKGYAIEFDAYQNTGDPSSAHVALVDTSVQDPYTHIVYVNTGTAVNDGATHAIEVTYYGSSIKVIIDGSTVLSSTSVSLEKTYTGIGFGAGTGAAYANHWIQEYVILTKYVDPEPSTTIGAEEYLLLISDLGSGAESVIIRLSQLDSGIGADAINMTHEARDSGAGSEVLRLSASIPVADSGSGVEAVGMTKGALDSGFGSELLTLSASMPVADVGAGVETVNMIKEALDAGVGSDYFTGGLPREVYDAGVGVEYVDMAKEALDAGAGAESINMMHESIDAGAGVDAIYMTANISTYDLGTGADAVNMTHEARDSGAGVEAVSMVKEALDYGSSIELVNMKHEALDYGTGVEAVNMSHEARDAGAGLDASTVTGIIPVSDSGSGIDIVTQMAKAIVDSGRGVEAVYISASVAAYDSGVGTDIIGIVAQISVEDLGTGVEFADWFLSMYGMVLIDNDDVGYHSIPYKDWRQKNIPVQVHRRSVSDKVYIDSDEIGDVVVEWEDKVSDVIPGERTLIVTGVVELYD